MSARFVFLLTVFAAAQTPDSSWSRWNNEGLRLSQVPDYPGAERAFRSALAEAGRFGEQDPRFAEALSNLSVARREQGDLNQAEQLARRVVAIRESSSGPDTPDVAWALSNLAAVLHAGGRDAEAEPVLRRALHIAETAGDDKLLGPVLNSLALTLMGLREPARAEPVLRRALAIFENSYGADSLAAAKAANNLGMLYRSNREYSKAETELRHALLLCEKNAGPDHPLLVIILNNLFSVLSDRKRIEEGEPFLRRALAICEKTGTGAPRPAAIDANLANLEASRGNYQASAKLLASVIEVQERTLGSRHPDVAILLVSYSGVLRRLHQNAEARSAAARANAILKTFQGNQGR